MHYYYHINDHGPHFYTFKTENAKDLYPELMGPYKSFDQVSKAAVDDYSRLIRFFMAGMASVAAIKAEDVAELSEPMKEAV